MELNIMLGPIKRSHTGRSAYIEDLMHIHSPEIHRNCSVTSRVSHTMALLSYAYR